MKKLIFIKLFLLGLFTSAFAGEMSISDGWIKAKRGQMTSAFVNIKNNTGFDDTLIGVKTKFAKKSEIHTVKIDSKSNAKMMKIKSISIPDNKTIKLEKVRSYWVRGSNKVILCAITSEFQRKYIPDNIAKILSAQSNNSGDVSFFIVGETNRKLKASIPA